MSTLTFQALGPLQAGQGSRAVLGLAITPEGRADPVVLIWVPEEATSDAGLLARIRREVDHAASLDHPHIVKVVGFSQVESRWARIVEFADGEPLRKILERVTVLPPRIALRIVCDACTGVHYAHMAGNDDGSPLVHGDVRPETLLISFGGVTKVTGYGALAFAPREMGGQKVGGRRAYSAPEQIIGGREAFRVPTDVYLLALTLYECLTGIVPWATQAEFFDQAVLTLPLPPPPVGSITPEVEKVLIKACAKKAADRYPTPFALREALEAAAGPEIATPEELATFLAGVFPESEALRADRKRIVDAGIADFIRKQWQASQKPRPALTPAPMPAVVAPTPAAGVASAAPIEPAAGVAPVRKPTTGAHAPAQPAVSAAPPVPSAAIPVEAPPAPTSTLAVPPVERPEPNSPAPGPIAPEPATTTPPAPPAVAATPAPAPTWPPREFEAPRAPAPRPVAPPREEPPPAPTFLKPLGWAAGVAAIIALVAWLSQPGAPPPSAARFAAQRIDAGAAGADDLPRDAGGVGAEALAAVDAGGPGQDAGPALIAVVDAGSNVSVVQDAGSAPVVAAQVDVSLTTSPEADLFIDGARVGKSPWKGRLAAGKHTVRIENRELGLAASRTFTAATDAPEISFSFEKGYVAVNAPEGSAVLIDGVKKGNAPITGDIPIYEGSHRIDVKVGQSTWGQNFQLDPAQKVRFNVAFE